MTWGRQIAILAAGLMASVGFGGAHVIEALPDYDLPDFVFVGGGKGRHYNSTPGGRAHKRWKRARASGINPRVRHG